MDAFFFGFALLGTGLPAYGDGDFIRTRIRNIRTRYCDAAESGCQRFGVVRGRLFAVRRAYGLWRECVDAVLDEGTKGLGSSGLVCIGSGTTRTMPELSACACQFARPWLYCLQVVYTNLPKSLIGQER